MFLSSSPLRNSDISGSNRLKFVPIGKESEIALVSHHADMGIIGGGHFPGFLLAWEIYIFGDICPSDNFGEILIPEFRLVFAFIPFNTRYRGNKEANDEFLIGMPHITRIVVINDVAK